MVLPIVFIPFILSFPTGLMIYWLTTNLWTTGQGIVTRRQMPRPAPPPEAVEPDAAEGGEPSAATAFRQRTARLRRAPAALAPGRRDASSGRRAAEGGSDERRDRRPRRGDAARRSARRSGPRFASSSSSSRASTASSVEFEVVTEGERGLLGVGYSPARVIARASRRRRRARGARADLRSDAREFVERIATAIGATSRSPPASGTASSR